MSEVLTCNWCGQRYEALLLTVDEPCPKISCDGTLVAQETERDG